MHKVIKISFLLIFFSFFIPSTANADICYTNEYGYESCYPDIWKEYYPAGPWGNQDGEQWWMKDWPKTDPPYPIQVMKPIDNNGIYWKNSYYESKTTSKSKVATQINTGLSKYADDYRLNLQIFSNKKVCNYTKKNLPWTINIISKNTIKNNTIKGNKKFREKVQGGDGKWYFKGNAKFNITFLPHNNLKLKEGSTIDENYYVGIVGKAKVIYSLRLMHGSSTQNLCKGSTTINIDSFQPKATKNVYKEDRKEN